MLILTTEDDGIVGLDHNSSDNNTIDVDPSVDVDFSTNIIITKIESYADTSNIDSTDDVETQSAPLPQPPTATANPMFDFDDGP